MQEPAGGAGFVGGEDIQTMIMDGMVIDGRSAEKVVARSMVAIVGMLMGEAAGVAGAAVDDEFDVGIIAGALIAGAVGSWRLLNGGGSGRPVGNVAPVGKPPLGPNPGGKAPVGKTPGGKIPAGIHE